MQFRDLARQYERLKPALDEAMASVFRSGRYIMGPEVSLLEEELARYAHVRHCVTCANGTDALTLALKVWEIGVGDAVFVPDFTFFSSAEVVALEGATPIFVDVDPRTFNVDPVRLDEAIRQVLAEGRLIPKVIVSVDLFGLPANYPAIRELANRYGLLVLEDGAQGFGGEIEGRKACSFGDIGTTSFFPAKPLGCYGDGGALFTDREEWADRLRSLRVHGKGTNKYDNVRIGLNSRLDTLQAAILRVKLRAFAEEELDAVDRMAARYMRGLHGHVLTPFVPSGYRSSWAQYTIQLPNRSLRDRLIGELEREGIPSMVYYPRPMHGQTAFRVEETCHPADCPVASALTERVLSLPMHPYLREEEVDRVIQAVVSSASVRLARELSAMRP